MSQLVIQNDYSFLKTDDTGLKHLLWESLRFRDKSYFHNPRYKQRLWDGYIEFFNVETGKFLTGLLPEVKIVLKKKNIVYEIVDNREETAFRYKNVDQEFLNLNIPAEKSEIVLHDYQADYINQVIKHKRGIIYAPTSAGKSLIMVGILKALKGQPTLVLQNRVGLAEQNYEEIRSWDIPNVGSLWGGNNKPDVITVASVQSIEKIKDKLSTIKVLIVDEVHDMMSKLPKAVYRTLKQCSVRVALSATPFKFGEKDAVQKYFVKGFFGPVLKTKTTETGILTTKELQNRDILSKSKCTFFPIDKPQIPYDVYIDAVTHGIAESYHFHQIITRLAKQQTGRTLILVDRIAHGNALHSLIPDSLWVQGKDNSATRKEVIEQLKKAEGNVVAIATQQIFNTGISVFVHNLINAAGGQAEHMIIQRMGRGLRVAKDKFELNYYDFIFNINEYLLDHSKKRIKILKEQGHEVIIKESLDI